MEEAKKEIKIEDLDPMEEASNKEAVIVRTTVQAASHYINEEDPEKKMDLVAALSVLAIAAGSPELEGMRLINIARKLLKG